jgi:hypothetical protein
LNSELRAGLLSLAMLALPAVFAPAQTKPGANSEPDDLFKTVQALDTELFTAYNNCDLDKLGSMVADDLEFYHDQTGLSTGKDVFLAAIKNNICGKVHRELVPGSLEVYPLKGFGAVEIGVHRFTHPNDPQSTGFGEAKFVTVWQLKDGAWKITRAISFDHHGVAK